MEDIIVRYISLPPSVKAYTATDENSDYNIYVNSRISSEERQKAISHELNHIRRGHFFSSLSVRQAETEAENAVSHRQRPVAGRFVKKADAVKDRRPDYLYRLRQAAGVSRATVEKVLHISHDEYARYEFGRKKCPDYLRRRIVILLQKYMK